MSTSKEILLELAQAHQHCLQLVSALIRAEQQHALGHPAQAHKILLEELDELTTVRGAHRG